MNELLIDFVGKTATEKIIADAKKTLLENKIKGLKYQPRPNIISLVHTENKDDSEILEIGGSKPNDLLTEAFLAKFSGQITPARTTFTKTVTMPNDITGSPQANFRMFTSWQENNSGEDFGCFCAGSCQIQVGQSGTPATRTDFNINTPFVGGAEASRQTISTPAYNGLLHQIDFAVAIPTTNFGTILESCLFSSIRNASKVIKTFLESHDNISPAVNFIAGQTIFVDYVIAI